MQFYGASSGQNRKKRVEKGQIFCSTCLEWLWSNSVELEACKTCFGRKAKNGKEF